MATTDDELTILSDKQDGVPDSTAARVALWRTLHVAVDPPPPVLQDEIGLKLPAADQDWRRRGGMDPQFTRLFRASMELAKPSLSARAAQKITDGDTFKQGRCHLAAGGAVKCPSSSFFSRTGMPTAVLPLAHSSIATDAATCAKWPSRALSR